MPAAPDGPAEALRRLASRRDPEAWAWLLQELGPAMRAVAGRLSDDPASADDAVQEALLTLRDHAGSFRPRAEPDADARRWVLRVAANAALNLRRGRRRAVARDRAAGGAAAPNPDPIERDETAVLVRDALGRLGEGERAAIVLHVVGGLGYEQVAAELRCPVGTAKTRVHRGLERLRRRLGPRAQALSIAAIAALLSEQAGAAEALPTAAAGLLDSAAHGATPPAALGAGHVLAIAVAIGAMVLAAAVAVPLLPRALRHEALPTAPERAVPIASPPAAEAALRTKRIGRDLSAAVTSWLAKHPRFGDTPVVDALRGRAGDAPLITGDFVAADGTLHDGFGNPFTITAQDSPDHRSTGSVTIVSSMGTLGDPRDDWGTRLEIKTGQWIEFGAGAAAAAPPTVGSDAELSLLLDREITVDFRDIDLAWFSDYANKRLGLPCMVDAALLGSMPKVSVKAARMRTRAVLDLLASLTGSSWSVLAQRVHFTERSKLDRALGSPLTVSCVGRTLGAFCADLATRLDIPIAVDPAVADAGPLTLKAEAIPAVTVLSQACEAAGARAERRGDGVAVVAGPGPQLDGSLPIDAAEPLRAMLQQEIHVDFQDIDLVDVVAFMQRVTNLDVVLAPEVAAGPAAPITISADRTPTIEVLRRIAAQAGLRLSYVDQAIVISRGAVVDGGGAPPLPRDRR